MLACGQDQSSARQKRIFGRFFEALLPNGSEALENPAKTSDAALNPVAFKKSRRELHKLFIFVLLPIQL
jgi:hypothetical protein